MTNIEGGVSGGGPVAWSVLAYRMDVESEIEFNVQTFSYANLGESRHTGLELEARGAWTTWVQPLVNYALVRVQDRTGGASSLQVKNMPKHQVSAGVAFAVPGSLSGTVRVRHTGGGFLDAANTVPLEGPTTVARRRRPPGGVPRGGEHGSARGADHRRPAAPAAGRPAVDLPRCHQPRGPGLSGVRVYPERLQGPDGAIRVCRGWPGRPAGHDPDILRHKTSPGAARPRA